MGARMSKEVVTVGLVVGVACIVGLSWRWTHVPAEPAAVVAPFPPDPGEAQSPHPPSGTAVRAAAENNGPAPSAAEVPADQPQPADPRKGATTDEPLVPESALVVGSPKAETYADALELKLGELKQALQSGKDPATAAYRLASIAIAADLSLQGRAELAPLGEMVSLTPRHEGEYRFVAYDSVFSFDHDEFPFFRASQTMRLLELDGGQIDFGQAEETLSAVESFGSEVLAALGR